MTGRAALVRALRMDDLAETRAAQVLCNTIDALIYPLCRPPSGMQHVL